MPRLYYSDSYNKDETIAIVKKMEGDMNDLFVNLEEEAMEKPPSTPDEAMLELGGDYYFAPIPRKVKKDWVFITYCAGPKGSRKTTLLCNWIGNYRTLTGNKVYLITSKPRDKTIEQGIGEKNIERVDMERFRGDESQIPGIDEFQDSLVCFDDFQTDPAADRIQHLMNVLAERGRDRRISIFAIYHNITSSHKTKLILTEADYFLIFPKRISNHHLYYFGKNYANIDNKKLLQKVKYDSGSHAVICNNPPHIILPQSIILPDYAYRDT